MKLFVGLLVALVATAAALPVNDPSEEVELVPPRREPTGNEDVEYEPGYTSYLIPIPINPYSFFDTFEEYFRSLRERLFTRFMDVAETIDVDPSKGNTTSVTKVINGHRVEINNTVYSDKNDNGDEIFRVQVIRVRPVDEDESTINTDNNDNNADNDEKTAKPFAEGTTADPKNRNVEENEIDPQVSPQA